MVKGIYAIRFYYNENALQSGWVSKENYDGIKNRLPLL
jgi:hypothetical protein